jgi:hypothetical protein
MLLFDALKECGTKPSGDGDGFHYKQTLRVYAFEVLLRRNRKTVRLLM